MAKRFKQIRLPDTFIIGEQSTLEFKNGWSENLLALKGTGAPNVENIMAVGVAIYALPGTRFMFNEGINDTIKRTLMINTLGVFQMDTEERPITGLYINEDDYNAINKIYPVIIDLIYNDGGGVS